MVDYILDIAVHKSLQIIYRIIDSVVGYTALRIVVSTDFCGTVAGRDQGFAARGYIIDIFLMLLVVNESAQS